MFALCFSVVACEPAQNYKRHRSAVFPSTWKYAAVSLSIWIVESSDDWACGTGDSANKGILYVKEIGPGVERWLIYPRFSLQLPPLCNNFQHL